MPSVHPGPIRVWRVLASAAALVLADVCAAAAPSVGVAVLHPAPWSPGDSVRDGAGEFEVLLCVAQLRHTHAAAGVVSVGDRNGTRPCGGERALRHAALTGVPIVKLAPGGEMAADPEQLFIDARHLTEDQAGRLLRECLERYGAPPAAADPERPTAREAAAIRSHLRRFHEAFFVGSDALVAVK